MKKVVEVLTILAALFGVVVGGIQTYDWVFTPAGKLKADIRYGDFVIPPRLSQNMDSLIRMVNFNYDETDRIISAFKLDVDSKYNVRQKLDSISNLARRRIDLVRRDDVLRSRGFWSVNLINGGDKEIKNVQVILPAFNYAVVNSEDGNTQSIGPGKTLSIGDFQPSQKANVYAWAESTPSDWDINRITIRHSEGFASINIFTPVSGLLGKFYRNVLDIWFLTMLITFVSIIILASWVFSPSSSPKRISGSPSAINTKVNSAK